AYLNEIGITSRLFPQENAPRGDPYMLELYDHVADPEDAVDPTTGKADIDRFADFMRYLAPPPRASLTQSAIAGAAVFLQTGCENCHRALMQTSSSTIRARPQACAAVLRFTSARHGFARRWHHTGNRCARGDENSTTVGVARTHPALARRACPNHRRRDTAARRRSRQSAGPLHASEFRTAAATARLPQVDLSAIAALSRLPGRRRDPHRMFADMRSA